MAKRQRTRRLDTEAVQGAGSYVTVKAVTFGEGKAIAEKRNELDQRQRELDQVRAGLLAQTDFPLNGEIEAVERERAALVKQINAEANALLAQYVLDWDWVDDNDQPLPKPYNNPEVFDLLTPPEIAAIMEGFTDTPKKSPTKLR